MDLADTIVAVSSATGAAARMIVRASGPEAFDLLRHVAGDQRPDDGGARNLSLLFDGVTCVACVYAFVGPQSYTGDDTVEFHIPGNPLLARMLLDTLIAAGARTAEPGEFTARAFLNGRLDLAAAEGVALTIAATHADELAAARRMLAGEVSRRVDGPMQELADVLALLESNLDFADEGISFVETDVACLRIGEVSASLKTLLADAVTLGGPGHLPTFVLVGRPNAGKSTLINALVGHTRAVASPVAGSTRDVLSADLAMPAGVIRLIDLAGLDFSLGPTQTERELQRDMQLRANAAIEEADFVIEVIDAASHERVRTPRPADLQIYTKAETIVAAAVPTGLLAVSAVTGQGLSELKMRLAALAFARPRGDVMTLTARQTDAVGAATDALADAREAAVAGPEVLADRVRHALDALGQIRGVVTPDDVLGRVFAGFCIGK